MWNLKKKFCLTSDFFFVTSNSSAVVFHASIQRYRSIKKNDLTYARKYKWKMVSSAINSLIYIFYPFSIALAYLCPILRIIPANIVNLLSPSLPYFVCCYCSCRRFHTFLIYYIWRGNDIILWVCWAELCTNHITISNPDKFIFPIFLLFYLISFPREHFLNGFLVVWVPWLRVPKWFGLCLFIFFFLYVPVT